MLSYRRLSSIIITAGIICAFGVGWSPVRAQEAGTDEAPVEEVQEEEAAPAAADPEAAITTENIDIPVDELQLLVKPLTLAELENEAAGWMQVLQAKAQEISQAEIAIKRQNVSIGEQQTAASELDKAKEALKAAEEAQAKAEPGTPEYEEVTKKVEEAKEKLKTAQDSIKTAAEAQKDLKQNDTLQDALKKAEKTGELDAAKETLDKAEKEREELDPGSAEYKNATEKIDKLKEAIAALEKAEEAKKGAAPDSPELKQAEQDLEKAQEELKNAREAIDGVDPKEKDATEQSSNTIDKAAALLENTEIEADAEEKVAGPTDVVDTEDNLGEKQKQLEKTSDKLEKSAEKQTELKKELVATVTELQSQQTAIIDRFKVVLDELERKGGKGDAYRKYIEAISTIQLDVKDTDALGVRLVSWFKSDEGGMRWAGNIGKFLGILIATIIASQLLALATLQFLLKYGDESKALRDFIVISIKRGGIVLGVMLALTALEVSLGPILALVGGISFVLAFALQSNLGNFASGLTLMLTNPFDVGDEVKVAGLWGWVDSITLAHTKIKGFGGQTLTLPNNLVWSGIIENLTIGENRKIQLSFRVAFDEDLAKVQEVIVDTIKSHPKVLKEPAPSTFVWAVEDFYISIFAGGWAKKEEFWAVYSEVVTMIKESFDKEGIKLAAIPTQNINLQESTTNGKMPHLHSEKPVKQVSEKTSSSQPEMFSTGPEMDAPVDAGF